MAEIVARLGLKCPIIQAPMAGVSSPAMAAAVSRAGALGSLGLGASGVDAARRMIREARALGAAPLNVNVFCHRPAQPRPEAEAAWLRRLRPLFERFGATPPASLSEIYRSFVADDAMVAMVLEEQPEVASFHFGLPGAEVLAALRDSGVVLIASATSPEEGQAIQAAGLDAVIAQGIEAGGHRGVFDPGAPDTRAGTLDLVRSLARRLDIPVIAAGGIMTGSDITTALEAGAVAAQLGTAFVACPESLADGDYRAALTGPGGRATRLTSAISGRPARCLGNAFVDWAEGQQGADIPDYPITYDAAKALFAAAKAAGVTGFAAQWAGQGAPMARHLPAAALVETLVREMEAARAGRS